MWGDGYSLTCMFGWLRWLYACHIVLSLMSGRPQRGIVPWSCRSRLSTPSLWGVLYVLCTPVVDLTNNCRLLLICALIWYICTVLVHILKMSDSVKRIKSPFKGPHFLFFLMIKTWALVALIKRLRRFLPPQVQGQTPAIERIKIMLRKSAKP